MNQKQRDFLIKKVEENKKKLIEEIKKTIPKAPDKSQYIMLALMSDKFVMKSVEEIRETLRLRAAERARKGGSFLESDWDYNEVSGEREYVYSIKLKPESLFDMPDNYAVEYEVYKEACQKAKIQIKHIEEKSDTLVTRITLASATMLQQMIDEVDAMGKLSVNDMVVKKLGPQAVMLKLADIDREDRLKLGTGSDED